MATYTKTFGSGDDYIAPSDGYSVYVIDGGAGTDTVFADAKSSGFSISPIDANGVVTVSGASGTQLKLTNVEKMAFKNGDVINLSVAAPVPVPDPTHITGTAGNDALQGTSASETIDGGLGVDTVLMSSVSRAAATLAKSGSNWTLSASTTGTDSLVNMERVQFSDRTVALDIDGVAGKAYRVYQAAFDRTPDNSGLKFWIDNMDRGATLEQVASGFLQSAEFQSLYGQNPTTEQFVSKLYNNVLHRAPELSGYNFWVEKVSTGQVSNAQALAGFAESAENQAALIGVIQNGIDLF